MTSTDQRGFRPGTIHTVREERDFCGRMVSETAYDALGAECLRIERDVNTGRITWCNVRDDIARERPELAAIRDDLIAGGSPR